jgi:DNA replication protein DnaC
MRNISDIISRIKNKSDNNNAAKEFDYCSKHNIEHRWGCARCEEEEIYNDARNSQIAKLFAESGLSPKSIKYNFDTYQFPKSKEFMTCKRFAEKFRDLRKTGTSMILFGKAGAGKTGLASSVMSYVIKNYLLSVRYVKASDLVNELNESQDFNSDSTQSEIREKYKGYALLVIDELDQIRDTKNAKSHIFNILDDRHEHEMPTIVISNLNFGAIKELVGDRTVDRLCQNGTTLEFSGVNQRQKPSRQVTLRAV